MVIEIISKHRDWLEMNHHNRNQYEVFYHVMIGIQLDLIPWADGHQMTNWDLRNRVDYQRKSKKFVDDLMMVMVDDEDDGEREVKGEVEVEVVGDSVMRVAMKVMKEVGGGGDGEGD